MVRLSGAAPGRASRLVYAMTNKTVLITGAARRIGAVIARHLHAQQFDVVIHYRRAADEAAGLADELNQVRPGSAATAQADLLQPAACASLIDAALAFNNRLDALVNNASAFYPTPLADLDEGSWDELVGTNLKAPLFLASRAAASLKKHRGCLVNIADLYGSAPLKGYAVYSVAKAGLLMLTRALARELAPEARVNAVAPGAILWPENMDEEQKAKILSKTPMGRLGDPADVAKAVHFLIADADYMTGQTLMVAGGRGMAL